MRTVVPVLARIISALLALALIAAGAVVIIEVVAAWVGAGWTILPSDTAQRFARWHWDNRPVVITIMAVGAIGLVAFLVGVWRRAPLTVPVDAAHDITFERRALEQSLRRHIEALDGVRKARVVAKRDRLVATVDTNRRYQPDELKERVEVALAESASRQHLALERRVRLRFQGGKL
ncbi:MAG: hypothetical protein QOH23_1490 [Gaiellaceae bacterium]|nr:hypothetical protein [Gaiellaceae bacterium]